MTTTTVQVERVWDEPERCSSARGWLRSPAGTCVGFYLDYGPDHYRSPHVDPMTGREWCDGVFLPCRDCEPGNVLAVAYPGGPGTQPSRSRYFVTVEDAKAFVERGGE